ncbi:SUKH-4 family immunity protein [Lentzea albidocapillata]|uniref:SUKH-4 immunity protein n=1 Tax=Lentzea albidocapillata TaxID=40571 RepID=A0A1W2FEK0_9PSEU|nr:SUKH-4 family immunity protein [Lentzea albidocapillata]SMD19978.1 SUKH-4 immunity protein [Lentzea albidocapillata]
MPRERSYDAAIRLPIVTVGDLPSPPDFESLEAWAGTGRVIRAAVPELTEWRLPWNQKSALISCGVPLLEGIVDMTLFAAKPHDGRYRLAGLKDDLYQPGHTYLVEPETGLVSEWEPSSGRLRFVNSSINHWLCSLHLVGTWFASSTAIRTWDEDGAMEDVALGELADLLRRITDFDAPAYGEVGDHETHFWPSVLDRWLY